MTGFTDVRFTAAVNFGKPLSHILVNGLLQSHRRGRWPLERTPHGKRTARRTEAYVSPPEGVVFGGEIASDRIVGNPYLIALRQGCPSDRHRGGGHPPIPAAPSVADRWRSSNGLTAAQIQLRSPPPLVTTAA